MTIDAKRIKALTDAREAAEKVITGMAEGPLKEKAFEIAFAELIQNDPAARGLPPSAAARPPRKRTSDDRERDEGKDKHRKGRKTVGPKKLLSDLADDGFFDQARALPDIVEQLRTDGHTYKQEDLSRLLQLLTQARVLRREQRDSGKGKRKIWYYQK